MRTASWPLAILMDLLAIQAEATDHPMGVEGSDGDVRDTQVGAAELRTYNAASHQIALAVMGIAAQLRDPIPSLSAAYQAQRGHAPPEGQAGVVRDALVYGYPVRLAGLWSVAPWRWPTPGWPTLPTGEPVLPLSDTAWGALLRLAQAKAAEQQRIEERIARDCTSRPL